MKKLVSLAALALATAALGATAARAGTDPVAQAQADLQKLTTDATALHSAVLADVQKIGSDAQSLAGSTDKKAARAALQADFQKLQSDRQALVPPVEADWKQLQTDLQAVKASKTGKGQLAPLLKAANEQLAQERDAVKQAVQATMQALQALKASFHK